MRPRGFAKVSHPNVVPAVRANHEGVDPKMGTKLAAFFAAAPQTWDRVVLLPQLDLVRARTESFLSVPESQSDVRNVFADVVARVATPT